MNSFLLNTRLGSVQPAKLQKAQYDRLTHTIEPDPKTRFSATSRTQVSARDGGIRGQAEEEVWAHKSGVNVLAVDEFDGRFLFSGGADASIRIWDLEKTQPQAPVTTYKPSATLGRGAAEAHTHALTSLSIYPFDPTPSTLITCSYDTTLKLSSVTPSSVTPVHTFQLTHTPFSHSMSPLPSSTLQIAVALSHPALQLLDLRSGLTTHTLPGHTGPCYSVTWSPASPHVLASASADSRALLFDVRRANAAFASLDLDDSVGAVPPAHTPSYAGRNALDWNARAHSGSVTGIRFTPNGKHIVTCGQDQRIRVWDAATGANTLVHFGPRIRNTRNGEFVPLISPEGMTKPGRELLFWANDDAKGEILVFDLVEGTLERTLRVPGVIRKPTGGSGGPGHGKLTSSGRFNCLAWRKRGERGGCELLSAHGDGGIRLWRTARDDTEDDETSTGYSHDFEDDEEERRRKRKRDVLGEIVMGLTKKPITFT